MSDAVWTKVESLLNRPVAKQIRGLIEQTTEYMGMVANNAPGALRDLVDYVRDVEPFFQGVTEASEYAHATPSTRKRGRRRPTRAEGYEKARLLLRSSYLERTLDTDESVLHFRKEHIQGKKLTQSQARKWLASPALRFLSREVFESLGIPVVAHTSRLVGVRRGHRQHGDWWTNERHVTLDITWRGGRHSEEFGYEWSHRRGERPQAIPDFPVLADGGRVVRLAGFPGSVSEALQRVSQKVAKATRWPEFDSALFVITGAAPSETGIKFQVRPEWTLHSAEDVIVLTIDAWVSPETVAHAYRNMQRGVLDGRSRAHDKGLDIASLAVELMPAGGTLPNPDDLFEAWNRRFPKERYDHRWRFRSHYKEAVKKLLFPGHRVLEKPARRGGKA